MGAIESSMARRQTTAGQWLIVDRFDESASKAVGKLKRGSGVLLVRPLKKAQRRQLNRIAHRGALTVASEYQGEAARVHNSAELRRALLRRVPMILLSPIFPTNSHPDWHPIPRMRAATLARLANRRLLALGGMNAKRYADVARLGFIGWAGISAFRT